MLILITLNLMIVLIDYFQLTIVIIMMWLSLIMPTDHTFRYTRRFRTSLISA